MSAMTAIAPASSPAAAPARHLVSVPTGEAVSTRLRVTRRGRLALTTVVAGGLLALGAGQALAGGDPAPLRSTTVVSGQTLGEIAAVELPGMPLDDAVVAIQRANHLGTSHVHAGQRLVIPAR